MTSQKSKSPTTGQSQSWVTVQTSSTKYPWHCSLCLGPAASSIEKTNYGQIQHQLANLELQRYCYYYWFIIIITDQLQSQMLLYSNPAFHQPLTIKGNSGCCCWSIWLRVWGFFVCSFSGCLWRVVALSKQHRQQNEEEIMNFAYENKKCKKK